MERQEHYQSDVWMYFDGHPEERVLYEVLFGLLERRFPDARVKVQKSQISFYNRHLFAAASLPVRRKKNWPERCILVTFGLEHRLESPRIAVATEPYPNRWTHHVVVARAEELDEELMDWLEEAYTFALGK